MEAFELPVKWKQLQDADFRDLFLPSLLLLAAAYLLFANTFKCGWTYDDYPLIVNNPAIHSLRNFWKNYPSTRPFREISFLIDHRFFGLDPAGYHIQSIFWHGLNAALIFILLSRLGAARTVAWASSLIFLVHPVHVEPVANISTRKDSLALAFSLLSFLAYMKIFQPSRRRFIWLAASMGWGFLAFESKQNALALPLVFMGYEKAFVPQRERILLRKEWPWGLLLICVAGVFLGWYLFFHGRESFLTLSEAYLRKMNYFGDSSESVYFSMVFKSWAFMFLRLLFPLHLALEYTYPVPGSWSDLWVVCALAGVLSYFALTVLALRRSPLAFLALVWIGAFWLPTSNLWPLSYFVADRYLYAPSVGFCIASALVLNGLLRRKTLRWAVIGALVLTLSVLTWRQNSVWQSPLSLWSQAVKVSPRSSSALNNLGDAYSKKKDYRQALSFFAKAAEVNPYKPEPHYNLGIVCEKLGDWQKAVKHYRRFIELSLPNQDFKVLVLRERLKRQYGVTF